MRVGVTSRPERSPWRWPAAALALTIAAAHVPITPEHLHEAPYIGWSFIALEAASVVLAATLAVRDAMLVWGAAAAVPGLALIAYVATRTITLPQIADDVGNWTEPLGIVALTAETLLVLVAVAHGTTAWRRSRLTTQPMALAGALLVVGLLATGCAAALTTG